MTKASESNRPGGFTLTLLPWILGAAMLAGYLLTLNHWTSIANVMRVTQVTGWSWLANLSGPLDFLITYPLRWLPAGVVPLALGVFSAVCAALTLALLARSVALLPHDRTHAQRQQETSTFSLLSIPASWLPPVLAVLVCGLQISFWEHATQGTSETFDLLIFAYLVRCLLEFRITHEASWLDRFALVYGLSIAQNWAMLAFLPCFLAAMIWIRGLRFFNAKFLLRSFVLWLAGLSLILLLPLLASFSHTTHVNFWQGLQAVFGEFKKLGSISRNDLLLLCLPSLVPLFIVGIRWPSYFGDTSPLGIFLATAMLHVVHAVFLLAGIWVAFNVRISPRQISPQYYAYSFLPVSYLTSLGVGYFSGYLLLVFRNRDANSRKRTHPLVRVLNLGVTACLWALLPLVAIVLVCRNLPTVLALRSESLRGYFSEVERFLPPKDAVILSDDPFRLMLLESFLDQHGKHSASLLIDTAALANPNYFPFLNRQYPQFKLATLCTNAPAEWRRPITAIQFLQTLSKSHPLYYLQPSFGLFFEFFYLEPHGLVYQMKPLPEGTAIPPLSPDVVAENQTFWQTKSGQFLSLAKANAKPRSPAKPTLLQRLEKSAHLKNDPDLVARILGISYSRAVDYWGVQMQKAGAYKEAEVWFTQAGDLNPDNVVAQVNLQFNQNFQASKPVVLYDVKTMEERLGYHRKWDQILNDLGPFDDPNYCYQLGMYFLQSSPGLPHQALQQLERVETLAPGIFRFAPFIVLQLLCYIHEYPSALAKADNLLAQTTDDESRSQVFDVLLAAQRYSNVLERAEAILKNSPTDRLGLFYKGASLLHLQSTDEALASLNRLTQVYTNDETLYQVFELMFAAQKYSNVVQMTDADLKSAPDNPTLLMYNGVARLRMQSYHEALTPLSHLLQLQPTNYLAYLNRGIAHLKLEDLDAARPDYVAAAEIKTNAFQAYYGLGEIAYRQKDFPDALKNYKIYLTLAPTNTEEAVLISKRVEELQGAKPGKR